MEKQEKCYIIKMSEDMLKKYGLTLEDSKLIKWWLQRELNQRHKDFQSSALPTEL